MFDVALRDVAQQLGGELIGDPELRIDRIGSLESATPSTITFVANPRYQAQLAGTRAGCVIVGPALRDAAAARGATIVTPDPYLSFAQLTQWWVASRRPAASAGVHASAVVDASVHVALGASVGALALIEAGAAIGEGAVIGPHCVVGAGARIGAGTRLAAAVVVGAGCVVGERCIVHSGVVIGADGFGFAPTQGRWEKIEQLGAVRIGNDVEIGANTCIDRGALEDTVIEDGVKLDNLVQIGHNVHAFRDRVKGADAVLFATPEYNRSVPGALKNAIDIGSRPYGQSAYAGKPAAVVSSSMGPIAGFGANHHLRQSLAFLDMPTLQQPEMYLGSVTEWFDAEGKVKNADTRAFLGKFAAKFADWIELTAPRA